MPDLDLLYIYLSILEAFAVIFIDHEERQQIWSEYIAMTFSKLLWVARIRTGAVLIVAPSGLRLPTFTSLLKPLWTESRKRDSVPCRRW